jgi:hypothetical protein
MSMSMSTSTSTSRTHADDVRLSHLPRGFGAANPRGGRTRAVPLTFVEKGTPSNIQNELTLGLAVGLLHGSKGGVRRSPAEFTQRPHVLQAAVVGPAIKLGDVLELLAALARDGKERAVQVR